MFELSRVSGSLGQEIPFNKDCVVSARGEERRGERRGEEREGERQRERQRRREFSTGWFKKRK